jgi:hypothetical protein
MWTFALIMNILHLAYHQVTTNVDLYPFNNIRSYTTGQRIAESTVNFITMGFPLAALIINTQRLVGIGCCCLAFTLCGEFLRWWKGYLFGASEKWRSIYSTIHKETITFLPPRKDNPVPNLEHCILHAITIITFTATLIFYLGR